MYSSYSFSMSALDGVEWPASRHGRALAPGKGPPVPIVQEAVWAPEPVWTQRLQEKSFASARDRTSSALVVQPVARHYTDWATRLTEFIIVSLNEKKLEYWQRMVKILVERQRKWRNHEACPSIAKLSRYAMQAPGGRGSIAPHPWSRH
jgi:hypothetical protein